MENKRTDWKECCDKKIAKSISPDFEMISSLKESSENKIKSSDELSISLITASSKFILAYDSVREILEALSLKKGYKIYNHECYTAFLKEVLNQSSLGDEFDDLRKIRNSINYYGKKLAIQDSILLIKRIKELRKEILKLLA